MTIITVCIMQDEDTLTFTYRDGNMIVDTQRFREGEFRNVHEQYKDFTEREFLAILPEYLKPSAPKVSPDGTIISGHARMRSR